MTLRRKDWVVVRFVRGFGLLPALAAILISLLLVACGGATAPGPNAISGSVEGGVNYLLLDWQEGLRIMFWDDVAYGGHFSSGSSSTADALFRQEGDTQGADGRGYAYTLETSDGLEADFAIDGVDYDLSQGNVFVISVAGDGKEIQQLDVDLAGVSPTYEGIEAFGRATPAIAAFIAEREAALAGSKDSIGLPELDQLAETILSNDLEARQELVHYTTAGCTNADGLGGPPKCQPGQAEDTPVDYLPVLGPGEGVAVLPEAIAETLDFPAEALYAVYRRADEPVRDIYYRPGEYGLFFATGDQGGPIQYYLVHADMAGRIVRLDYLACPVDAEGNIIEMGGMVCSPEQIMDRDAGEILWLAPQ